MRRANRAEPTNLVGWSATVKLGGMSGTLTVTVVERLGARMSLAGREPFYRVSYSDGREDAAFGQHGLLAIVGVSPPKAAAQ